MRLVATGLIVGTILVACATPSATEGVEEGAEAITAQAPLTTTDAISRATEWSNAKLQYCWTPNGGNNHAAGDYSCATICKRQSNPAWDPYRSDCSGLVSWAWGLPAPGRTTLGFAPFQNDITTEIQAKDLRAGDAINNSEHVMLFKAWVEVGKTATFIEEPGCSSPTPYAHEVTSAVTIDGSSITPAVEGRSFTAIRYAKLVATAPTDAGAGASEPPLAPAPANDDGGSTTGSQATGDDGQPTTSSSNQSETGTKVALDPPSSEDSSCAMSRRRTHGAFALPALALGLLLAARRRRRAPK